MRAIIPFIAILLSWVSASAQVKAVELKYPGTDQRWTREYSSDSERTDELVSETIYHANSTVWMTANYGIASDPHIQEWSWFYDNGNPLWSAYIKDDKLVGLYRHWYENGQPAELITFENNIENGPAIFYYENGSIAMQGYYVNGVMRDFEFFDPLGERFSGSWEWRMFPVDEIRMRGEVKDGRMTGEWTWTQTANSGRVYKLSWTEIY